MSYKIWNTIVFKQFEWF